MEETRALRNTVARYSLIVGVIVELVSLIFTKGFDLGFAYGLAIGTVIGIVNFSLLAFALSKAILKSKRSAGVFFTLGFVVRLLIFGAAFLIAYDVSLLAGIACLIGFITVKISIYYVNFAKKSIFTSEPNSAGSLPDAATETDRIEKI